MRPEVRRWGPAAGVFVTPDTAVDLLAAVSDADPGILMGVADEPARDVYRVRWNDGVGILRRFEALTDAEMASALGEVGRRRGEPLQSAEEALAFLGNLRASAAAWETCCDPDDGSLELLVGA
jgi:hypothetical protein